MTFLDCPAYLDQEGAVRCGLPAEVRCRFIMRSSDGPLEGAMIRCPAGHWFNGAIESLTWESTAKRDPGAAGVAPAATPGRLPGGHNGRAGTGGSVCRGPGEPGQAIRRPNTAPAYYLGRAASVDHRHEPTPQGHRIYSPDASGQAMTPHALHTGRLTVLRAAALFDGVSPTLIAAPTVVVANGVIAAVHGPAGLPDLPQRVRRNVAALIAGVGPGPG